MDRRLPYKDKRLKRDKTQKGLKLVEERKRTKRKGSVTFHIDNCGNVANIENREFF